MKFCSSKSLKKWLIAYAANQPELCQQTDDDEQGGLRFEIDKSRISIRLTAPCWEERRIAASELAKVRGIQHIIIAESLRILTEYSINDRINPSDQGRGEL